MSEGEWQETEEQPKRQRLAWALTGSGHDFVECLDLMREIGAMDVFLSKAAAEVIFMYTRDRQPFPPEIRLIRDTSASAAPVGRFYHGWYHTLVVAPATSNTVAKCVAGISDTLVTNVFAQAGKCRVPIILYACDTRPVHDTMAPDRHGPALAAAHRPREHGSAARLRGHHGGRGHGPARGRRADTPGRAWRYRKLSSASTAMPDRGYPSTFR